MKVLLILYGHYRTFDITISSWISSLEGCDFECRFVTFDKVDHSTKCWRHDRIKDRPNLTDAQIELLKKYDPNTKIISQELSQEELDDVYASLPHKVFIYKYNNIKEMIESVDDTKYELIIISRFDIKINNIKFKDVKIEIDEIKIGGWNSANHYKNISVSDALCAFHPANKNLFYNIPKDIITRKFKHAEECYTDFYFQNFKIVNYIWQDRKDFLIQR
jgi:hypothetical protein